MRAIRADADIETVANAIYGALFFRLLLRHAPLDAPFVRRLLDGVQRGLGAGPTATARSEIELNDHPHRHQGRRQREGAGTSGSRP